MTAAQQADFFGEGTFDSGLAGAQVAPKTTADLAAEEELKRQRAAQAALAALPYGTPTYAGGTATNYQVNTFAPDPNSPQVRDQQGYVVSQRVDQNGAPTSSQLASENLNGTGYRLQNTTAGGGEVPVNAFNGTSSPFGVVSPSIAGVPNLNSGQPATGPNGAMTSAPATANALASNAGGASNPISNGQNVAGGLADQALATQPPAKPNLTTPVVDPSLASSPDTATALAQSQDLINRILNTPLQTKILGDQALSNQLAMSRGARGGPGAIQNAEDQARQQAPQLQEQANQGAIQEQVARAGAAGQAASIYANVAGGNANRAVQIAQANQAAGLDMNHNLVALTGQQVQFTDAQMQTMGSLASAYLQNSAQFANLDVQKQIATWNNLTQRYQVDAQVKGQIEAVAAQKNIGPLDALKMVLGVGEGLATAGATLGAGAAQATNAGVASTATPQSVASDATYANS